MIPRHEYHHYFSSFGNFTDSVTILLKKQHSLHETYWRDELAEPNARWYLDRLNKLTYGRQYLGGHKSLPVVTSYEVGSKTSRPHFHMAIERPKHLRKEKFHQFLRKPFQAMDWAYGTIDILDYTGDPFIRYICKGDFEKILVSCCTKG